MNKNKVTRRELNLASQVISVLDSKGMLASDEESLLESANTVVDEVVEVAQKHFSENHSGGFDNQTIFESYAKEEKDMDEKEAEEFAIKANDGETEPADQEEMNKFYTWYYLNYMVEA